MLFLCFKGSVTEDESESAEVEEDSYSFHKFSGPVSGEVREVVVPNTHPNHEGETKVDYVVCKYTILIQIIQCLNEKTKMT